MLMHVADGFTAAAVLTGLWAAFLWWRSGRVGIDEKQFPPRETLDDFLDKRFWDAFNQAIDRIGVLNGHAAIWTAVSVAAQAFATLLGRLAAS